MPTLQDLQNMSTEQLEDLNFHTKLKTAPDSISTEELVAYDAKIRQRGSVLNKVAEAESAAPLLGSIGKSAVDTAKVVLNPMNIFNMSRGLYEYGTQPMGDTIGERAGNIFHAAPGEFGVKTQAVKQLGAAGAAGPAAALDLMTVPWRMARPTYETLTGTGDPKDTVAQRFKRGLTEPDYTLSTKAMDSYTKNVLGKNIDNDVRMGVPEEEIVRKYQVELASVGGLTELAEILTLTKLHGLTSKLVAKVKAKPNVSVTEAVDDLAKFEAAESSQGPVGEQLTFGENFGRSVRPRGKRNKPIFKFGDKGAPQRKGGAIARDNAGNPITLEPERVPTAEEYLKMSQQEKLDILDPMKNSKIPVPEAPAAELPRLVGPSQKQSQMERIFGKKEVPAKGQMDFGFKNLKKGEGQVQAALGAAEARSASPSLKQQQPAPRIENPKLPEDVPLHPPAEGKEAANVINKAAEKKARRAEIRAQKKWAKVQEEAQRIERNNAARARRKALKEQKRLAEEKRLAKNVAAKEKRVAKKNKIEQAAADKRLAREQKKFDAESAKLKEAAAKDKKAGTNSEFEEAKRKIESGEFAKSRGNFKDLEYKELHKAFKAEADPAIKEAMRLELRSRAQNRKLTDAEKLKLFGKVEDAKAVQAADDIVKAGEKNRLASEQKKFDAESAKLKEAAAKDKKAGTISEFEEAKRKIESGEFAKSIAEKELPVFKNTHDAIAFGKKASPEQVAQIEARRAAVIKQAEKASPKEKLRLGQQAQWDREAIEAVPIKKNVIQKAAQKAQEKVAPAPSAAFEEARRKVESGEFAKKVASEKKPPEEVGGLPAKLPPKKPKGGGGKKNVIEKSAGKRTFKDQAEDLNKVLGLKKLKKKLKDKGGFAEGTTPLETEELAAVERLYEDAQRAGKSLKDFLTENFELSDADMKKILAVAAKSEHYGTIERVARGNKSIPKIPGPGAKGIPLTKKPKPTGKTIFGKLKKKRIDVRKVKVGKDEDGAAIFENQVFVDNLRASAIDERAILKKRGLTPPEKPMALNVDDESLSIKELYYPERRPATARKAAAEAARKPVKKNLTPIEQAMEDVRSGVWQKKLSEKEIEKEMADTGVSRSIAEFQVAAKKGNAIHAAAEKRLTPAQKAAAMKERKLALAKYRRELNKIKRDTLAEGQVNKAGKAKLDKEMQIVKRRIMRNKLDIARLENKKVLEQAKNSIKENKAQLMRGEAELDKINKNINTINERIARREKAGKSVESLKRQLSQKLDEKQMLLQNADELGRSVASSERILALSKDKDALSRLKAQLEENKVALRLLHKRKGAIKKSKDLSGPLSDDAFKLKADEINTRIIAKRKALSAAQKANKSQEVLDEIATGLGDDIMEMDLLTANYFDSKSPTFTKDVMTWLTKGEKKAGLSMKDMSPKARAEYQAAALAKRRIFEEHYPKMIMQAKGMAGDFNKNLAEILKSKGFDANDVRRHTRAITKYMVQMNTLGKVGNIQLKNLKPEYREILTKAAIAQPGLDTPHEVLTQTERVARYNDKELAVLNDVIFNMTEEQAAAMPGSRLMGAIKHAVDYAKTHNGDIAPVLDDVIQGIDEYIRLGRLGGRWQEARKHPPSLDEVQFILRQALVQQKGTKLEGKIRLAIEGVEGVAKSPRSADLWDMFIELSASNMLSSTDTMMRNFFGNAQLSGLKVMNRFTQGVLSYGVDKWNTGMKRVGFTKMQIPLEDKALIREGFIEGASMLKNSGKAAKNAWRYILNESDYDVIRAMVADKKILDLRFQKAQAAANKLIGNGTPTELAAARKIQARYKRRLRELENDMRLLLKKRGVDKVADMVTTQGAIPSGNISGRLYNWVPKRYQKYFDPASLEAHMPLMVAIRDSDGNIVRSVPMVWGGEQVRLSFRPLKAGDEFYGLLNERSTLDALAYRALVKSGDPISKTAKGFRIQIRHYKQKLGPAAIEEAMKDRAYYTLLRELGPVGEDVIKALNYNKGGRLLKGVFRFIRTLSNVGKIAVDHSLAGLVTNVYVPQKALYAGGKAIGKMLPPNVSAGITAFSKKKIPALVVKQIGHHIVKPGPISAKELAKVVNGTIIGGVVYNYLKSKGFEFRGPAADNNERMAWHKVGFPEMSIKHPNGTVWSFSNNAPATFALSMMAIDDAYKNDVEAGMPVHDANNKRFADAFRAGITESYLDTPQQIAGLLDDMKAGLTPLDASSGTMGQRPLPKFFTRFGISQLTPNLMRKMARTGVPFSHAGGDNVRRQPFGVWETFISGVPGLAKGIRPAIYWDGSPVVRGKEGYLTPVRTFKKSNDKLDNELVRLKIYFAPPMRSTRGVPLTDQARYNMTVKYGPRLRKVLNKIVHSKAYDNLPQVTRTGESYWSKDKVLRTIKSMAYKEGYLQAGKVAVDLLRKSREGVNALKWYQYKGLSPTKR